MAKVLITGAAGFVGCNLSNWLMQHTEHQLVGVDNMTTFATLTNLEPVRHSKRYAFYLADAHDENILERIFRVEKPNYVIHATGGTLGALVNAASKHPVERLLVLNYLDRRGALFVEERQWDDCLLGARLGLEETVVRHQHHDGVGAVAVNLCDLYGPREAPARFIPNTIYRLLNQELINPEEYSVGVKEWMYIKDAFLAICLLLKYSIPGYIYNITANYRASDREMLYKIADIVGVDVPELGWRAPEYTPAFNENQGRVVNINSLGWRAVYGFDESLEHTVSWFHANRWAFKQEMEDER